MKRQIIYILSFLVVSQFYSQSPQPVELNYYAPTTYILNKLTVSGTPTLEEAIISISGLKEGDEIKIPGDQITNAIRNIWAQNLVEDVEISIVNVSGVRIDLNIEVLPLPRVDRFDIVGEIKKGERNDLLDEINVVKGQHFTAALQKNTKNIIENFLKSKGYYYAKAVAFDTLFDNQNLKNVTFKVIKGRKVKVRSIIVDGNNVLTDKEFRKKIKNTKEAKSYRFWKRSKYVPSDFRDDKDAVLYYYNSLGLRDFEIDKAVVTPADDKKYVNLNVGVTEGKRYYFGNIKWVGNYKYEDVILDSILGIKNGDVFNQELLDTRLNFNPKGLDVSSLYMDNGYLFFNVNPVEVSIRDSIIDLEMRIYEGEQATYNKIVVKGNTKTNDHVVLREIRTLPGQKFSRSDLIRTQRELAQLGYFDAEQIGINPIPNPATGTVDIEYSVVEKPNDQLQLSGGWGGATGFVGTLGLAFNNFSLRNITKLKSWDPLPSGDGQRLSLRFQANFNYWSYGLSFTEPWLGGRKPNSLTLSFNHSRQSRLDANNDEIGHLSINSATMSLGRRLKWPDSWFTLVNALSLTQYDVHNYPISGNACSDCITNNFKLTTTLARNNIGTNPNYPTMGGNISVSMALTPPYSLFNSNQEYQGGGNNWVEFHKWMFDFSQHMQLTNLEKNKNSLFTQVKKKRSFVLVTRAHFGFIGRYNSSIEQSEYERFEMGGSGLSGYNSSFLLGTDIIALRGYSDGRVVTTTGGNGIAFSKYVMELRYPVITEGIATIYLLGFLEGGNNFATFEEFNPFDIRRSAGFGARIFMPAFGLIGIDYGKGFDKIPGFPNANDWQFHFTIGQQLR